MISKEEQEKMINLFSSPIKKIREENDLIIIEFKNGVTVPLISDNSETKIDIPQCSFCNKPALGENELLFTINDKSYICVVCNTLAMETFLKNGADIKLKLGEEFDNINKELKKLVKNIEKN